MKDWATGEMQNLICKQCGKELPAELIFCQYCGCKVAKEEVKEPEEVIVEVVEETISLCKQCGKELAEEALFCQHCGCKVEEIEVKEPEKAIVEPSEETISLCKQCGKEVDEDSMFCEYCGCKVEKEPVKEREYIVPIRNEKEADVIEEPEKTVIHDADVLERNNITEEQVTCKKCGKEIDKDSVFCEYCGCELENIGVVAIKEKAQIPSGKSQIPKPILVGLILIIAILLWNQKTGTTTTTTENVAKTAMEIVEEPKMEIQQTESIEYVASTEEIDIETDTDMETETETDVDTDTDTDMETETDMDSDAQDVLEETESEDPIPEFQVENIMDMMMNRVSDGTMDISYVTQVNTAISDGTYTLEKVEELDDTKYQLYVSGAEEEYQYYSIVNAIQLDFYVDGNEWVCSQDVYETKFTQLKIPSGTYRGTRSGVVLYFTFDEASNTLNEFRFKDGYMTASFCSVNNSGIHIANDGNLIYFFFYEGEDVFKFEVSDGIMMERASQSNPLYIEFYSKEIMSEAAITKDYMNASEMPIGINEYSLLDKLNAGTNKTENKIGYLFDVQINSSEVSLVDGTSDEFIETIYATGTDTRYDSGNIIEMTINMLIICEYEGNDWKLKEVTLIS